MIIQLTNQLAEKIIALFNKEKMTFSFRYWNFDKNDWSYLGYAELCYFNNNIYNIVKENEKQYLEVIEVIGGLCTGNKEQYELDNKAKNIINKYI